MSVVGHDRNVVLQKLIKSWESKNAQTGKRIGTFALMTAGLAACNRENDTTPSSDALDDSVVAGDTDFSVSGPDGNGIVGLSGLFAFLSASNLTPAEIVEGSNRNALLDVSVNAAQAVDITGATELRLADEVTVIGDIGDFDLDKGGVPGHGYKTARCAGHAAILTPVAASGSRAFCSALI